MEDQHITELCDALLLISNRAEALNFLRDIATPKELLALAERWKVCRLLASGKLSYREIHKLTGASLTTIGRVARSLKDERYGGYQSILKKIQKIEGRQ